MNAYTLKFHHFKLILVTIMAFSILPSFGQHNPMSQDVLKRDTLLYFWRDTSCKYWFNVDNYIELYLVNGTIEKGYFWGMSDDEFDMTKEENYFLSGFFVLPLSEIRQYRDSVSFRVGLAKTEQGKRIYSFVRAPIDRHIRSWQEALTKYVKCDNSERGFDEDIRYNLSSGLTSRKNDGPGYLLGDTILIRNISNPYSSLPKQTKIFVRQKKD